MKWLKLHNEILHDPKLKLLAPSDRWYFVAILCCKNEGYLEEVGAIRNEMIAVTLGLDIEECLSLRDRLVARKLINTEWQPVAWEKRQDSPDKSAAVRQARYREKQRGIKKIADEIVTKPSRYALRDGNVTAIEGEVEVEVEEEVLPPQKPTAVSVIPYNDIVNLYHQILPNLPTVQKLTAARKTAIKARWTSGDLPALKNWENFFEYIGQSPFLTGKVAGFNGKRPFLANLEWVTKEANYTKILEEFYHGV